MNIRSTEEKQNYEKYERKLRNTREILQKIVENMGKIKAILGTPKRYFKEI